MKPGECWYTNVKYTHSVHNRSQEDRIHLVIDGIRNDWSDELFFSHAPEESFREPERHQSPEELKRIIEELKMQNAPAAQILIKELEAKLRK